MPSNLELDSGETERPRFESCPRSKLVSLSGDREAYGVRATERGSSPTAGADFPESVTRVFD